MPTPITTLRLDPALAKWAKKFARDQGVSRSDLIRDLLWALRERRLVVVPEPLPHLVNDGSDPRFPVSICHNPK